METKLLLFLGFGTLVFIWTILLPFPISFLLKSSVKHRKVPLSIIWVILLFLQCSVDILSFRPVFPSEFIKIIGLILYFAGIAFASWGRLSMKASWGMPAQHDIVRQKRLVTTGAFRYSRNPIYVGLFVAFIGFELALQSALVLLAIPVFFMIQKIIQYEEILIYRYFGKEWEPYQRNVRRFI